MVVVGTDRAVDDLPVAAALVASMNRLLLVAIATAKPRFTTDPVVAWRAAVRADEETARLAASAQQALTTSDVQYAIEPISYRAGDSPARLEHRIAAAAARFARRRNAVLLPNWSPWSVPDHGGDTGMSTASVSTGQGAPILAVLCDSLDAVCTAGSAGQLALPP